MLVVFMATHGTLSLGAVFRPLTSHTSVRRDWEDILTPQTALNTIETGHVITPGGIPLAGLSKRP